MAIESLPPVGPAAPLAVTLTGLFVFHAVMTGTVLAVTVVAVRRFVPVLVETDGTDVSEGVTYWLRLGTLAGGLFSTAGFASLAVGEAVDVGPTGVVAAVTLLIGAPLFAVAFGALVALVLRVRYIRPAESSR